MSHDEPTGGLDEVDVRTFIAETRKVVDDPEAGEFALQRASVDLGRAYQRQAQKHIIAAKEAEHFSLRLTKAINASSPAGAMMMLEKNMNRALGTQEREGKLAGELKDLFELAVSRHRAAMTPDSREILERYERELGLEPPLTEPFTEAPLRPSKPQGWFSRVRTKVGL